VSPSLSPVKSENGFSMRECSPARPGAAHLHLLLLFLITVARLNL
jgi:hypothetical protein